MGLKGEYVLEGRIVNNISNLYYVKSVGANSVRPQIYECASRGKFKNEAISPVVGDMVEISILEGNKGVIEQITPRISYLKRPKIANINQIIFVVSLKNPKPDLLMLDKQLCYAEYLGIEPLIIFNKVDLVGGGALDTPSIYSKIGYKVLEMSATNENEESALQGYLKNKISAFAGNSGVGKSTITNSILKKNVTQIGEISDKNKRGKNTTTNICLYEIDNNTYIADTPGFSTFDITEIESIDLCKYFIEFKQYIKNCEYIGCGHIKEESCGIKEALKDGIISEERYNRYCKIYEQLKLEEERKW